MFSTLCITSDMSRIHTSDVPHGVDVGEDEIGFQDAASCPTELIVTSHPLEMW